MSKKLDAILEIIGANPGITSFEIHEKRLEHSRMAAWFGRDSLMTEFFGPSFGVTLILLGDLEDEGLVRWEHGAPNERGYSPRHFWLKGGGRRRPVEPRRYWRLAEAR